MATNDSTTDKQARVQFYEFETNADSIVALMTKLIKEMQKVGVLPRRRENTPGRMSGKQEVGPQNDDPNRQYKTIVV